MLHTVKKRLYFVVATYFAFWAKFVLRRWQPRIIVITGSSGKTSLLHLTEAQLGDRAVYSHHANSAIGIPFHILGLESNITSRIEWLKYFVVAPFHIWRQLPEVKLYVVEADCDRPNEGAFTAKLLKPEVVMWISVYNTHSMNFDNQVKSGQFTNHEAAIANEFGNFVAQATKLIIANGDQTELVNQLKRAVTGTTIKQVSATKTTNYQVKTDQTIFSLDNQTITLPGLHPKDTGLSLQMVNELTSYLGITVDPSYQKLIIPPGRNNIYKGQKNTTLIDSTYNNGLGAATAVITLLADYPFSLTKWLVMSDILEQGSIEADEHKRLALVIEQYQFDKVILLGRRTHQFTYPLLQAKLEAGKLVSFITAGEVLDYLNAQLHGGEVILFKGALGLEGVIEQLLADPKQADQLVRRGSVWTKRRQDWGLPR
ncbi:MAG TPA: hypothetical protein VLF39_02020 [Candidatus Saccharimonadales bacterium]|nr:hypothetical protein [Candidatus Saccharimonadales bacterium]